MIRGGFLTGRGGPRALALGALALAAGCALLAAAGTPAATERAAGGTNAEQAEGGGGTQRSAAAAADRDCSDFATQAEAQRFFIGAGGPQRDPHRLDSDGDGIACEALPCPCSIEGAGGGRKQPKPQRLRATALRAIDGDTIRVRTGGRRRTVRLLGIDTPEKFGRRECGAGAASSFTNRLLKGRRVKLTTDPTQDRKDQYGRLLAYVDRGKRSAQVAILARGLAMVYVVDGGLRRIQRFRRAESRARDAGRGAWSKCGGDFHRPAG